MSAAMKRGLGPLVLLVLPGLACGETRLLEGFSEGQTRVRLEPREFVGSVLCKRNTPGALHAYMVRFQEVDRNASPDAGYETAFSSGAAACDQAVMFTPIAGRFYGAEIYGFDREPTASDLVVPNLARWRASCGHGSGGEGVPDGGLDPLRPTFAQRGFTVPMRGCTTFDDVAPDSAQLVIDQASALGSLRCGQGAGEVSGFQASLGAQTVSATCGQPLVFVLPPNERYYTIELTGLELGLDGGAAAPVTDGQAPVAPVLPVPDASIAADASAPDALDGGAVLAPPAAADAGPVAPVPGVPRWRTQCVGQALPGLQTSAYCDPLQPLP
jgi:hypothetical protein